MYISLPYCSNLYVGLHLWHMPLATTRAAPLPVFKGNYTLGGWVGTTPVVKSQLFLGAVPTSYVTYALSQFA